MGLVHVHDHPGLRPCVTVEDHGPIRVVSIDRVHVRNAVDGETAEALRSAFHEFDADPVLSVGILTGSEGVFCAGADLGAVSRGDPGLLPAPGIGPMGPTCLTLSKPVIAAVEGWCVAGGLELALWCDLRIATPSTTFGVFCRRFGVPLIDLGTVRLPRLIGHSRAMDLILTGRGVPGDEALAFGLANRLVPDGSALDAALDIAQQIAAHPQACLRNDRASALAQWGR